MNRWQEIWNKRAVTSMDELTLADLMDMDGFATSVGAVSLSAWRAYVERRLKEMGVAPPSSVFEVGCGAGAFLWVLRERGYKVAGIDYSSSLAAVAAWAMPDGRWLIGEADQPLGDTAYDAVVANSVFHYFPNHDYARRVLSTMLTAARQAVAVLDVPDAHLAAADVANREAAMGQEEYAKRYAGLAHLLFTPQWFKDTASGWDVTTAPQDIPGYGNNPYRFNVIVRRREN